MELTAWREAETQSKQYELINGKVLWVLHATHGLPVEFGLPLLADTGHIPTWDTFLQAAAADGTNVRRLVDRLQPVVVDAYGSVLAEVINTGLRLLVERDYP